MCLLHWTSHEISFCYVFPWTCWIVSFYDLQAQLRFCFCYVWRSLAFSKSLHGLCQKFELVWWPICDLCILHCLLRNILRKTFMVQYSNWFPIACHIFISGIFPGNSGSWAHTIQLIDNSSIFQACIWKVNRNGYCYEDIAIWPVIPISVWLHFLNNSRLSVFCKSKVTLLPWTNNHASQVSFIPLDQQQVVQEYSYIVYWPCLCQKYTHRDGWGNSLWQLFFGMVMLAVSLIEITIPCASFLKIVWQAYGLIQALCLLYSENKFCLHLSLSLTL